MFRSRLRPSHLLHLLALTLVSTHYLEAESGYETLAVKITKTALETNWDYEKSYLAFLCASKKRVLSKMPTANQAMKSSWETGREDANYSIVLSATQGKTSKGIGVQTDVLLKDPNTEKEESHRYWFQSEENGSLCLSGFNF